MAQTIQTAFLQRVLPGFNLLLGPEAQPRGILSALSTITGRGEIVMRQRAKQ